jgi:hypothetical protein
VDIGIPVGLGYTAVRYTQFNQFRLTNDIHGSLDSANHCALVFWRCKHIGKNTALVSGRVDRKVALPRLLDLMRDKCDTKAILCRGSNCALSARVVTAIWRENPCSRERQTENISEVLRTRGQKRVLGEIFLRWASTIPLHGAEITLFKTGGSANYCLAKPRLWAHYLSQRI